MLAPPGRLTIDLDAIVRNWRKLCDMAAPAAVAGVVKADAYGLGMDRVAPALHQAGCSLFFVAGLEEGAALRALLPDAGIAVLSAPVEGFQTAYRDYRLLPVLNHPGDLAAWPGEDAVLHIDTGMTRLGLDPADAAALDRRRFRLVMSHLACADEPDHPLNEAQRRLFAELAARFDAPASLANSSGIFLGPGYRFDTARPGMALYGLNPTPGEANPMQPVVRLEAACCRSARWTGRSPSATARRPKSAPASGWPRLPPAMRTAIYAPQARGPAHCCTAGGRRWSGGCRWIRS